MDCLRTQPGFKQQPTLESKVVHLLFEIHVTLKEENPFCDLERVKDDSAHVERQDAQHSVILTKVEICALNRILLDLHAGLGDLSEFLVVFTADVDHFLRKAGDSPTVSFEPQAKVVVVVVHEVVGPEEEFELVQGLFSRQQVATGDPVAFLHAIPVLLHVVDACPLAGEPDPKEAVRAIEAELGGYSEALATQPRWLVVNKLDLLAPDERDERVDDVKTSLEWTEPAFGISAATGEGTAPS